VRRASRNSSTRPFTSIVMRSVTSSQNSRARLAMSSRDFAPFLSSIARATFAIGHLLPSIGLINVECGAPPRESQQSSGRYLLRRKHAGQSCRKTLTSSPRPDS